MIRTIFFDFGNVIGFFDHGRAVAALAGYTSMDPIELAISLYGSPIADDYECGRISTAEFVRWALANCTLTCTHDEFLAIYTDIFWPNPEVCNLIPQLRPRYHLILASNTNEAHYLRFTRDFATTLRHFAHLVPSHHAGARKPHSEYFAFASRHAIAEPGECLFIDDLPNNVAAASRAGFIGIVYAPGNNLTDNLRAHGVEFGDPGR